MGIAISGLDMPEPGEFKHIRIYGDGSVTVEDSHGYEWDVAKATSMPENNAKGG